MPQKSRKLRYVKCAWTNSNPTPKRDEQPLADSSLASLPFELKKQIASYLDKPDLKSLRLVSFAFSEAAKPCLAASLALPLFNQFATWLKENPTMAHRVKKVSHLPTALTLIPGANEPCSTRSRWWAVVNSSPSWILALYGRRISYNGWANPRPRDRQFDFRKEYYQNWEAHELGQAEVLDDQLSWFTQVFRLLPCITEIDLLDFRQLSGPENTGLDAVQRNTLFNHDFGSWRSRMELRGLGNRGSDEAYCYQICYMLIGAADAGREIKSLKIGHIPWTFFKESPLQKRFLAALKNVRHLSFSLTCGIDMNGELCKDKKKLRGLAKMIAAPDSLESLDIDGGWLVSEGDAPNNNITLSDLVTREFPKLRSLKLQSIECRQDILVRFLREHASTLRELELNNITLTGTYPANTLVLQKHEKPYRITTEEAASWPYLLLCLREGLFLEHFEVNYTLAIGCDKFWYMGPLPQPYLVKRTVVDHHPAPTLNPVMWPSLGEANHQIAVDSFKKKTKKTPCKVRGKHVNCMKARVQDYVLRRGGSWAPGMEGDDPFGENDECWKYRQGVRLSVALLNAEFLNSIAEMYGINDQGSELSREMMATFLKDLLRC